MHGKSRGANAPPGALVPLAILSGFALTDALELLGGGDHGRFAFVGECPRGRSPSGARNMKTNPPSVNSDAGSRPKALVEASPQELRCTSSLPAGPGT